MRLSPIAAALFIAACAPQPAVKPGTSALPPLAGTNWRAEDIAGSGVVDNAEVTAAFADGRISGRAGCNSYNGTYQQSGNTLKLGPLAMTRRACVPALMDVEGRFLAVLGGVSSGSLDATGALVLRAADGRTVLLRRFEAAVGSLEGGPWYADGFPGDAQGKGRPEVSFEPGDQGTSQVSGTGGCNRFSGAWKQEGTRISLGPLASTMMMCPEPAMASEQKFLALLGAVNRVTVKDNVATLTTADGATLVLRRAP